MTTHPATIDRAALREALEKHTPWARATSLGIGACSVWMACRCGWNRAADAPDGETWNAHFDAALAATPAPEAQAWRQGYISGVQRLADELTGITTADLTVAMVRWWARDLIAGAATPKSEATPAPEADSLDPIAAHVNRAAAAMLARMRDGERRGWGASWKSAGYPDADVGARLARAVEHLQAALSGYRLGAVGPDEMAKRAADVANQAFFLADWDRLEATRRG